MRQGGRDSKRNTILSNIVASQIKPCFGGVVPEIASRHHVESDYTSH